jgi:hypothetical protein
MEAVFQAYAGRSQAERCAGLLDRATDLAGRRGLAYSRGLIAHARGEVAHFLGRWKDSRAFFEQAERVFREECRDVAWELHTAQTVCSITLLSLGEIAELVRRMPLLRKEAEERGELYTWTNQNFFLKILVCLALEDLAGASAALDELARSLPDGFNNLHVLMLLAEANVSVYRGEGPLAWEGLGRRWPAVASSGVMRLQIVRILLWEIRGRCALAAAAGAEDARPLVRAAGRDADRLERERTPWSAAHALLLRAGATSLRGEAPRAASLLEQAVKGFETIDMKLYAAAARRRQGELLGVERGQALVTQADTWMSGQGIRNPARMAALLAPGFPAFPTA